MLFIQEILDSDTVFRTNIVFRENGKEEKSFVSVFFSISCLVSDDFKRKEEGKRRGEGA